MLQIFSNIFTVLYILLVVGTIIIILTDNQDSGRKISWILVIGLVPVLGLICYVVFGFNWRRAGFFQRRHRNFLHEFDRKADDRIKDLLFGHSSEEKIQVEKLAGLYAENDLASQRDYQSRLREVRRGVDTYWLSQPLRTSVQHRHAITLEGGSQALRYKLYAGLNVTPGVMKGSKRSTQTANLDLSYRFNKEGFETWKPRPKREKNREEFKFGQ